MSVLIFTENRNGTFPGYIRELVTWGRQLADRMQMQAVVLSPGEVKEETLAGLGKYGAGRVLCVRVPDPDVMDNRFYADVIMKVAEKIHAEIFLFAYSNTGKALAPIIAARYGAAYVSAVTGIPEQANPFVVRKKIFSGKVFTDIRMKTGKKVMTLAPHAVEAVAAYREVTPEILSVGLDKARITTRRLDVHTSQGKVLLTDANVVVSGGRGMQNPGNFSLLEELAGLLGGAVACTRPVSDEGWRPADEHAGQTGKIIAPDLYFAFGISGAIQHLAGVSSSKVIAAVNTDPDAPIFEAADYGVVADAMTFLPKLIEAVKRRKSP